MKIMKIFLIIYIYISNSNFKLKFLYNFIQESKNNNDLDHLKINYQKSKNKFYQKII